MDKFTPLTTARRSESVVGSWKSQDSPDTQLRVSDRLSPVVIHDQAAQARWTSQFSQRKLLAASVLPKPTCTATPTPVFGTVTHFFFQFLDLLESLVLISGVVSIRSILQPLLPLPLLLLPQLVLPLCICVLVPRLGVRVVCTTAHWSVPIPTRPSDEAGTSS